MAGPWQYENRIWIRQGGRTVTLPPHAGQVERVVGPVTVAVPDGTTNQEFEFGYDTTVNPLHPAAEWWTVTAFVFGMSDVNGVKIQSSNDDPPEYRVLSPWAYLPEDWRGKLYITNDTGRDAVLTFLIGYSGGDSCSMGYSGPECDGV